MYLVGADHPNKKRVLELIPKFILSKEKLITSAECFQEIIHRYKAINNQEFLQIAYEALESLVHSTEDVSKLDTDQARNFSAQYPKLSSRDCLHLAIMKRFNCERIWTYDLGFDQVSFITRVG